LQSENLRPYGGDSFNPNREIDAFAYLSQPLELGGKRARRVDVAAANERRAELERGLLERQIAARVRQSYWTAVGAQHIYELLQEDIRNFRQIVDYHEARVREGAMAEADLLRVRIEGERLALAANRAGLEAERTRIDLFRNMGAVEFPSVRLTEALEVVPLPPADVERALENRVEVRLARHQREAAAANLRLQQSGARPNMDIVFGYKRTSGFNSLLGGIEIDLPYSNRNQGNVAAAQAEIRVAESEFAATQALVRAEVRAAEAEAQVRRRQLTDLLQGLLERAAESSRIALAAYREGGSDLLRLLDAERVRIEIQTLYSRTLAEYRQSVVALETAMGTAP
jgi:outer membrane protein TolC